VIVAGVSMVVTQRSEFTSVIQRQGVDGLIERLRTQVSNIPAQAK
jgi:phospholipid transport system substrate-binding protein